jgi:biopolymer transport protein ExbB
MKKLISILAALSVFGFVSVASAQDSQTQEPTAAEEARSLDDLLQLVKDGKTSETNSDRQREATFRSARAGQQKALNDMKNERTRQERISAQREATRAKNEIEISRLHAKLQKDMGDLSELFGVLQQVAGDARGIFAGSLISAQFPGREAALNNLIAKAAGGSDLPTIEEMESLWFEVQREMTESGKITRFTTTVSKPNGESETVNLTRIGDYNIVGDGKYYVYDMLTSSVAELGRQPAGMFTETISNLESADPGDVVAFGVDPNRGSLLAILVSAPTFMERIDKGGFVGYLILTMGAIAMLFVFERFFYLLRVKGRVRRQIRSDVANVNNPLGRVLKVYEENQNVDVETLELKLDEAILKETPALERFLTLIKLVSAVAPLFGLLGTVTGMIATFQAITLFGTGDPKLMANGISQALVTTVEGLSVAIPTLLAHSFVAGMSKSVIHVLEEQSAGIIALHAEKAAANG